MTKKSVVKSEKSKTKSSFVFLSWLALILIFVVATAGGYCVRKVYLEQTLLNSKVTVLQNIMNQVGKTLKQKNDRFQKLSDIVTKLSEANGSDWQYLQAKKLIDTAAISLTYQHDVNSAISALTAAEKRLEKTNKISHANLQKQIQKDIAKLEVFKPIDTTNYYLALQKLSLQISQMTFMPIQKKCDAIKPIPKSKWQSALYRSIKSIKGALVIQHYKDDIKPLYSLQNQQLFKGYLLLLIAQAQTALLQHNSTVLQAAITQIKISMQTYAGANPQTLAALLNTVNNLPKLNLKQSFPDLNDLTKMIEV